ncbi:MAG: hypothetical protein ABI467_03915 [Kofleriaceae bacterium]
MAAVLVHVDLVGDRPDASSLVALAAGRHVASSWGATLYAAVVVHDPHHSNVTSNHDDIAATSMPNVPGLAQAESALARAGADKVVIAVSRGPISPLWSAVGNAWRGVVDHLRPRLVLFGADAPSAAELGPRTAARIGARLLLRARATGIDDVELRDRDGGYARVGDGGAAVALIGRAPALDLVDDDCDVDVVVLAMPGEPDDRIELVTSSPAEIAYASGTMVVLGDDVAADPRVIAGARRLARMLDAHVVGGAAAVRSGAISNGGVIDKTTPLAPELIVTIGGVQVDVAGATSVIKVGASPATRIAGVDGVVAGPVEAGLAELVKKLEAS